MPNFCLKLLHMKKFCILKLKIFTYEMWYDKKNFIIVGCLHHQVHATMYRRTIQILSRFLAYLLVVQNLRLPLEYPSLYQAALRVLLPLGKHNELSLPIFFAVISECVSSVPIFQLNCYNIMLYISITIQETMCNTSRENFRGIFTLVIYFSIIMLVWSFITCHFKSLQHMISFL